jgi:1-acyl-sn-glycerol-3-phosphate acyltransferase
MEINEITNLRLRDLESMSTSKKIEYFKELRSYCLNIAKKSNNNITITQKLLAMLNKKTRPYDFEVIGKENVPDCNCLFLANHSNAHDAFTTTEFFSLIGKPSTFFASNEGLSKLELKLFESARSTLINRFDVNSTKNGMLDFSSKLLNGDTGIIFGEGTWNLHPIKPMQNIKIGPSKIAAIAQVPIVPVIYEYVEVPDLCSKETQLYSKCIVKIGKPINIDCSKSLIEQNMLLQKTMEKMRVELWSDLGINKNSIYDINPEVYVNHTWMKKFGTSVAFYDSERENKILRSDNGIIPENEYTIDSNGDFVPGIIKK